MSAVGLIVCTDSRWDTAAVAGDGKGEMFSSSGAKVHNLTLAAWT